MLLTGKRILVTGVLNDQSIAYGVARVAQEQGAEVVLSSFGRIMRLTERTAKKLPTTPEIVELDVTDPEHLEALAERLPFDLDGVVHAIGFAPESCLGGGFLDAPWEDVAVAMQVSAYSLKALAVAALPRLADGGAIVGLDFDNQHHAWPVYDWMGVAKAAFESTARYLARELGPRQIRVNLVAAGPLRTLAAAFDSGLRAVRGGLGRAVTARLGHPRHRARGQGRRGAAVGLVPGDDGGDRARRRRLPRHRCVTAGHASARMCRPCLDPAEIRRGPLTPGGGSGVLGRCAASSVSCSPALVLGAIALVAVGLSGGVAAAFGATLGTSFVSGDPPGTSYSRARCAEFHEYAPHTDTCERAATEHHYTEVVDYRLAAGVVGVGILATAAAVRRRRPHWLTADALPVAFDDTVATVAFALTAAGLLGNGIDQLLLGRNGAGFWLSGGIVAAAAAVWFASRFVRNVATEPVRAGRRG